jgi:pentafunctional AROM polypeptide
MAALNGLSITLETIGSGSLQGDAQFAKKVLEPMGCQVIQTERETKVIGPSAVSELRQIGEIDMEEMTDAFLTACVVLGVAVQPSAKGQRMSTRIIGIANQRVKECNRIAAMVAELGKMGIHAQELEDGIEVFGTSVDALAKRGDQVRINCYDDHRIAMAFSVLGTVPGGKGLILNEKRCVEKTWPSWWDDLSTKLGIQLDGVPAHEKLTHSASAVAWEAKKPETPSIVSKEYDPCLFQGNEPVD